MLKAEYDSSSVFTQAKEVSKERKCQESFEVIIKLNVDPTKGDQNVRGTCVLPKGTGKAVNICVFADEQFNAQINEVGDVTIGNADVLKEIAEGTLAIDKILATAEFMPQLKAYAR